MPKPIKDMSHAELIALSRENAERYDARAAEHEAKGEADEATKLREWARRSREEADLQEGWTALRPEPKAKPAEDPGPLAQDSNKGLRIVPASAE